MTMMGRRHTVLNESQNQNKHTSVNKNDKTKTKLTRSKDEADDLKGRFKGGNPKVWLYLYRVKSEVSEENLLEYLKQKTVDTEEAFVVKELKTSEGRRFKEFMFVVAGKLSIQTILLQLSFVVLTAIIC